MVGPCESSHDEAKSSSVGAPHHQSYYFTIVTFFIYKDKTFFPGMFWCILYKYVTFSPYKQFIFEEGWGQKVCQTQQNNFKHIKIYQKNSFNLETAGYPFLKIYPSQYFSFTLMGFVWYWTYLWNAPCCGFRGQGTCTLHNSTHKATLAVNRTSRGSISITTCTLLQVEGAHWKYSGTAE